MYLALVTLSATIAFTLNSVSANSATFGVIVNNDSSGPGANSLMDFGIDVVSPPSPPCLVPRPREESEMPRATTAYRHSRMSSPPDAVTVPEPASIALLGIDLAGLGFSRRRTPN